MDPAEIKPSGGFSQGVRVQVLLPLPLAGPLDYRVGAEPLAVGDVVSVPLGRRHLEGVVWGAGTSVLPDHKLKTVAARLDCPAVPAVSRAFVDWVADYTLAAPGAVLRMVMPVPAALAPAPVTYVCRPAAVADHPRPTPARRRVLDRLADGPPLTVADLAREAGVTPAVVKGLIAAGAVVLEARRPAPDAAPYLPAGPALSPAQAEAAGALTDATRGGFSVSLLDGVTGSGKTEVYFEAIASALAQGRQVLVLLPEIALSAQFLSRFARRFAMEPAVWHSDLGEARRRDTWRAVAAGAARVVVGARSALFLPFPDLGLIVIDEEHDGAFKQEDGVAYHARDMAVVRGKLGKAAVILASATPSLETLANVQAGRYRKLHLPDRHAGAVLPDIQSIDLRKTPPPRGQFLAPPLRQALAETLKAGEQAMLFLNRRGYAPLTLCRTCGHRLRCPHCTAWLVDHRGRNHLACHHCGFVLPRPRQCPECGAEDDFAACGPGVERIAEEAGALFPEARLAVMASDTMTGPAAAAALVDKVAAHEIDLLIGTQIVAKGHHFPLLTLVGVVDADLGLEGGDLRAGERTLQLLSQVAGRAGRAERPGRVLLQSFDPDHPVLAALAAGDRDGFVAREADSRRAAGMPPYGRLAAVIVSGPDADSVDALCRHLARSAPSGPDIEVLGPVPAPLALLRGRHRRRFLIRSARATPLQTRLRAWLDANPARAPIRIQVDIDPYGFL